jgi:hypothetical protein
MLILSKAVQHRSMYAQACRLNLQGASEIPNVSRSVPTAHGNEIRKGGAKATGRIGVEQNVNIAFMQHIHNSCVYYGALTRAPPPWRQAVQ